MGDNDSTRRTEPPDRPSGIADDYLGRCLPLLGRRLDKVTLTSLPTPVRQATIEPAGQCRVIYVKHDDESATLYGGNKVRKLEFLLRRALDRGSERVATFGTTGSHHAIATALYAKSVGLACTCFLAHQHPAPGIRDTLLTHVSAGTELVRYGGARAKRIQLLRDHLWQRNCSVIPAGGSSWLGSVGFINAGLELAHQIAAGECPEPQRIYVATGTMGTTAGIALGLALAGIDAEVQAVRVSIPAIANPVDMRRLVAKTASMLRRLDPAVPADLAERVNIRFRDRFFAGGYAHSDAATRAALAVARTAGLRLESTYTGKAFAALLADQQSHEDGTLLFWNTCHGRPLPAVTATAEELATVPAEFARYLADPLN